MEYFKELPLISAISYLIPLGIGQSREQRGLRQIRDRWVCPITLIPQRLNLLQNSEHALKCFLLLIIGSALSFKLLTVT